MFVCRLRNSLELFRRSACRGKSQTLDCRMPATKQRMSLHFRRASTTRAVAPPSFLIARQVQLDYNAFAVPECLPKRFPALLARVAQRFWRHWQSPDAKAR
jgi:hypothetical protein